MSCRRAPQELPLPARREYMTGEASLRGLRLAVALYPGGMRIGEHAHEKPSLTAIAGGGLVEVQHRGARPASCEPGAVVLRPAGEPHANDISSAGVVNVELEIDPAFLEECGLRIERAAVLARPAVTALASRLRRELGASDRAKALLVEGLALEMLALSLANDGRRPASPPAWLSRAHERLRTEFREKLTIAALAADAGLHPVYFARAFREAYGVAPGELLRKLRIEWAAAELVRRPARSVARIASDAGYCDHSHFARAFAAMTGRSPLAHRAAFARRPAAPGGAAPSERAKARAKADPGR
ncbi:AraC family transcriptional regulator [Sorangium sp. So ce321]|uniref:AraC family transcriptional regulator n=1 Tax=Sorangium sp. So ce321 TaxID=3133300 RepID=UPI003F5E60BD